MVSELEGCDLPAEGCENRSSKLPLEYNGVRVLFELGAQAVPDMTELGPTVGVFGCPAGLTELIALARQ